MENSGLSASDVLALTRDRDGDGFGFGGVGRFYSIVYFSHCSGW